MLRFLTTICLLLLLTLPLAAQDIFFEDYFENGDTGWVIPQGTSSVSNGKLLWRYEGDGLIDFDHKNFGTMSEAYEINFDLKLSSANNAWRLGFGYNITDDNSTWLAMNIYSTGVFYFYNLDGVIIERERSPYNLLDGESHQFRIVNTPDVVQFWIDGILLYEVEQIAPINGKTYMLFGAHNNRGATTIQSEIDNYVIKPYEPPVYTLPENGILYDQPVNVIIEDRQTVSFPFLVNAEDVVDFTYLVDKSSNPIYSVYMPDGTLWIRKSNNFLNTILPVSGIWSVEFSNRDGRTLEADFQIRLISTKAESVTSLGSFVPTDISGRYLAPILKRIYISPNTGLALLHETTFLIGERPDGMIILSEDQAALDAALADPGFIANPEHALRYIWLREDSSTNVNVAPQAIFQENFSQFAARTENLQTAFSWRDWYFWRFNPIDADSYRARTFAIRIDPQYLAVGYEVQGSQSRFDEFDSIDIIESLGLSFPYLNDDQRAALELPLNAVDAPTIEVNVDLPRTHSAPRFTFNYPDGAWRVSENSGSSAGANFMSGVLGMPVSLIHEPPSGTKSEITFFTLAPATVFSASTWIDILNLTGAQMFGVGVDYQFQQVYVNNNLMTIVETNSAAAGKMVRFEVRLSNAQTVTMIIAGEDVDLIDRDTLLAIAGSLTP